MDDPDAACAGVECPADYCEEDGKTRVYNCKCDPADGECGCLVEVCSAGCNTATGKCVESMVIPEDGGGADSDYVYYDNSPDPLGVIVGIAAGGGALAGGGYLAYKGIQTLIARRALAGGAKAAVKTAAEPSLGELLNRAEQSADRASKSIDQALKGTELDQQRYEDFVRRRQKYDAEWSKIMDRRAQTIAHMETGVDIIKKSADAAADLIGNVPGVGKPYKYIYQMGTTAAESAAGGDSIGQIAIKTASKGVETLAGDTLFGKISAWVRFPRIQPPKPSSRSSRKPVRRTCLLKL